MKHSISIICRWLLGASLVAAMLCAALGSAWAEDTTTVKLGFTGPLSGGAALYGKNVISGLEMAINEINAAGLEVAGKKVKLELVALDDMYSPAEAAINARRLVQQSNVPVVFCPHSGGIYALQAINEQENFIILGYASSPKITEMGNKLTVRVTVPFDTWIEPFTRYQMKRFGKRVGMMAGDHEYAKDWARLFQPVWERAGGIVVSNNPISYNKSADFYSGVSRVLADKPDVLFIGGASEPTGLVIKQARELGFKGGFLIIDQAKMDEIAKVTDGLALLEGAIGVPPLALDSRVGAQSFVAAYHKLYGADRAPTTEASYNYTMTYVLAAAMKLAGTTSDAAAIRAKMSEAVSTLSREQNAASYSGINAKGGTEYSSLQAVVVEGGKIRQAPVGEFMK